jgi:hypothetical protein
MKQISAASLALISILPHTQNIFCAVFLVRGIAAIATAAVSQPPKKMARH